MDEVNSGDERREGLRVTGRECTVCGNGFLGVTKRGNLLYQVALTRVTAKVKVDTVSWYVVCWEGGVERRRKTGE